MKEYEVVSIMCEGYGNRYSKMLDVVVSTINNKHYDMLKLDVVKSKMDEVYYALELKVRYDTIYETSNGKLTCDKSGFDFDGHKFETLDEVEKAIKNKVFL